RRLPALDLPGAGGDHRADAVLREPHRGGGAGGGADPVLLDRGARVPPAARAAAHGLRES
ncbi:unnamed protein product, partial [Heterosigma akashiwo]